MAESDDKHLNKVDDDLSELLDSSLQDFGRSIPLSSRTTAAGCNGNESVDDNPEANANFDPKSAQQAAADFQTMLKQIAEVQKIMLQNMAASSGETQSLPDPPSADVLGQFASAAGAAATDNPFGNMGMTEQEEMQFAESFMKNMQFLADKAQKVQEASNEDEFTEAMKDLSNDETYETEFLPFMQGLMGSLLSKEMLYPSLKEMCDKYPGWLDANRSKLDSATLERYETQLRLIREACNEYESEKETDTDEERGQRFERLVITMQKMQACGHPPEDLVGALPPGWGLDKDTGLPRVEDTEKAAEACSIM